jgi:hypothetical protein
VANGCRSLVFGILHRRRDTDTARRRWPVALICLRLLHNLKHKSDVMYADDTILLLDDSMENARDVKFID